MKGLSRARTAGAVCIAAVSLLLCTVPLFFYDLVGEKKDRITKELAEQRAARGVVIEN